MFILTVKLSLQSNLLLFTIHTNFIDNLRQLTCSNSSGAMPQCFLKQCDTGPYFDKPDGIYLSYGKKTAFLWKKTLFYGKMCFFMELSWNLKLGWEFHKNSMKIPWEFHLYEIPSHTWNYDGICFFSYGNFFSIFFLNF